MQPAGGLILPGDFPLGEDLRSCEACTVACRARQKGFDDVGSEVGRITWLHGQVGRGNPDALLRHVVMEPGQEPVEGGGRKDGPRNRRAPDDVLGLCFAPEVGNPGLLDTDY